jgi:hypothetical protein
MTLKEAIYFLRTCKRGDIDFQKTAELIAALLAAQKREREVFKRLSRRCEEQVGGGALCTMNPSKAVSCTMRTCPLL